MDLQNIENLMTVFDYLPHNVRQAIRQLPAAQRADIQEIRLRTHRPVSIVMKGEELFLTQADGLARLPEQAISLNTEEIARSFQAVCSYSVYSHERDLAEGFVTIRGGCRVGICGTANLRQGEGMTLRHISSMNFRIAGAYPGIAESVWNQIGQKPAGILVAGPVGSGKTTFLRDLCRLIGNRCRTALIDERGELAAMQRGIPQHEIGRLTDVLDGYPRAVGILTALRVMSPQVIVCDEISTGRDADAILQASGCGVSFAASCHAGELDDLSRRTVLRPLIENGVFRYCVLLERAGSIRAVRRLAHP